MDATLPTGWVIVQSLATVDSTTFEMYMQNMRAMMQDQLFAADVVIFNRTDDETDRGKFRRLIKTFNRKAQIVYERKDGTIDERPEELPFDINADVIEPQMQIMLFGLWMQRKTTRSMNIKVNSVQWYITRIKSKKV